jgi:hypothetical protein
LGSKTSIIYNAGGQVLLCRSQACQLLQPVGNATACVLLSLYKDNIFLVLASHNSAGAFSANRFSNYMTFDTPADAVSTCILLSSFLLFSTHHLQSLSVHCPTSTFLARCFKNSADDCMLRFAKPT